MSPALSPSTRAAGFWSALLALLFGGIYILAQLAEWSGMLGSHGGPESTSTPRGIVLLLTPSLLLGPSFVLLMASVHIAAPPDRKVWSLAAVCFAGIYAALTGLVYFVQLTLVGPRMARGAMEGIEVFRFVPFDSFLYAVDILGYSFMSLASLAAARAFPGGAFGVRLALTANGLLLPFVALQMFVRELIWIAALWAVTFPAAMAALARWYYQAEEAMP